MSDEVPTVLVVDDERDLADLYAAWLEEDFEVRTAYGGESAIAALDESVDVALVDRLMPTVSGDDVLEYVRSEAIDTRISMVTAVEPDFDIVEMGFDEYVVKPIRRETLLEVVESLVARSTYDEQLQEFYALASKRAALQSQKSDHELNASGAYADLVSNLEQLRTQLDRTTDRLSVRDMEVELRQLNADGPV